MMLTGKVAWITGASRGIGVATARLFAREGAQLVLCARETSHLKGAGAEVRALGAPEPILLAYDVSDPAAVGNAFRDVFKQTRRLDVLVNNAGVLDDALLGMVTPAQVQQTFATNVNAVIYHMQYASRLMARARSGSIINLSSIMGRVGNVGETVYAASKSAVIGATYSAAKELAPSNIRVNAVAPGFIDTDMTRKLPQEKFQEGVASVRMGRAGTPGDVANAILFLASDLSAYVTGQVLGVDGGMLV